MRRRDGIRFFQTEDLNRMNLLLGSFLKETGACSAVLMDRTGRLLTTAGDTSGFDGIAFATLAAADFSASDQLATLLGEEGFTALYHHGDDQSMYLAAMGDQAILAALFNGQTTLGLVRLKIRAMEPEFAALFTELAARNEDTGAALEPSWADEAADKLDRLFAD